MRESILIVIIGIAIVIGIAAIGYAERADWVDACVADGQKHYECEERYDIAHPPAHTIHTHAFR